MSRKPINYTSRKKIQGKQIQPIFPSSKMEQLGKYLKHLRMDLDMSLRDAALCTSISPAHLSKIERGTIFKSTSVHVLIRLSEMYNIPLISILEEAGLVKSGTAELPDFSQYLRSKYNLSPQAIRDLETAKEVVDKKYRKREQSQTSLF